MTTNNINLSNGFNLDKAHDLSSFEPEALFSPEKTLASLPGEHPRMAAGLAIGREASHTGHLDVAELSSIANELYAEGFPAGAFGDSSVNNKLEIPSTASFSDAREPTHFTSSPLQINDLNAAYLQHVPSLDHQLQISHLLSGIDDPQQVELNNILAGFDVKSLGSKALGGKSAASGQPNSSYYFLQDSPLNVSEVAPSAMAQSAHPAFDANLVRKDFPILGELVNGRPLIWFDNAATTQKPQAVIDRLAYFYAHENSNIHRAAHELAARATDAYEDARETVRRFINAPSVDNIVFVRGTTEAINLVAKTYGKKHLGEVTK